MANTLKIKRSSVSGKIPQTSDLLLGELALNTYSGRLYTKIDNGTPSIVEIGGAAGSAALDDLTDVSLSSPSNGQVLKYNGTAWANAADSTFSGAYADLTGKPTLATVATSGAYADLSGTPSLATVATSGAYADLSGTPSLATVATSGAYADLTGKPTVPSSIDDLSDVTLATPSNGQVLKYNGTAWANAADSTFSGAYADLTGKPTLATVATSGAYADLSGTPSLATVATSGAYADLTGKPTVPSALDDLSDVVITSAAKGQVVAHNGTSFVNTRTLEADSASTVPLTLKGAASQSANLLNLTDSSDVTLAAITASSRLRLGTTAIAYSEIGFNSADSTMRVTSISDNCFSIASPDNGSGVYTLTVSRNTTRNTWEFSRGATNALAYNFNTYAGAGGGLGVNLTAAAQAELHVNSNLATKKGCIIRGAASQTANLLEAQNSAASALFLVNSAGALTVSSDVFVGKPALGTNSFAAGKNALTSQTAAGGENVAVGIFAASALTAGYKCTAVGYNANVGNSAAGAPFAHANTSIGWQSGGAVTGSYENTCIGAAAGDLCTGSRNVFLGYYAGATVGAPAVGRVTVLGYGAKATGDSALAIGDSASAGANAMDIRFGGASRITGNSSGQIGINVASATAQLQVNAGSAATKGLIIKAAASATANLLEAQNSAGTALATISAAGEIFLGVTSGYRLTVWESAATNAAHFRVSATSAQAFVPLLLDKADNDSTTANKLVLFRINNTTGSGQINANGASQAAFGTYSDERLKENIVNLPSQLENVIALRPVEFDYRDGAGHQIGFIAQEVRAIYPDLVSPDSDGFLTLTDLNKNDARMVKAIQELYQKVVALEARVAELEGA